MKFHTGCGKVSSKSHQKLLSLLDENLAIFDATAVCGVFHLNQCALLAAQAHENGYNLSKTKSSEVLLYLSAQRQVTKSIKYAGISEQTSTVAWVSFNSPPDELKTLIIKDHSVISENNFNYEKFGLSKKLISSLSKTELTKLVTTKCATLPVRQKK